MTRDPGEKFRSTQLQFDFLDSALDSILEELDDLLGPCGDEEDESYGVGEPTDAEDHEAEEDTSDGI